MHKRRGLINHYLRFWLLVWIMIGAGVGIVHAKADQTFAERPLNLVLITIDTLRADHLGCYGYAEAATPNINSLAHQGIMFTKNYTPVPITLPSHVSIMTGLYPPAHGVRNNGTCVLGRSALTLAEILKGQGYQTAAFIGAYVLHSRFGLDQGFDEYDDRFPSSPDFSLSLFNEKPAAKLMDSAIKWMEEHKKGKFFLWIHLFDPHAPYDPPSPFREPYKLHLYDGEIAYVDSQVGRLLKKINQLSLDNNTLLVLTADHGEGLDEHNEKTHAVFIYDSTMHVPLIFYCPDLLPASKKIPDAVCTIDILPTILDIFKIPSPTHLQGCSLMNLLLGKETTIARNLYCESYYPELNFGWSRLEGLRTKEWKFIEAPQSELYNLIQDPQELHNRYIQESLISESLRKELHTMKNKLSNALEAPPGRTLLLDAQTKKRLESLGYVWAKPKSPANQSKLPDPKDMINTLLNMDIGVSYSILGLYKKAIEYLQKVISTDPTNMRAHFYLATNYEKAEKYDESIAEYKKVIEMNPDYSDVYNCLGTVYEKKGLTDLALKQFQIAEQLNGNYLEVYYNLGSIYNKKKQYDTALTYLKKAADLDPNHPNVRNNLGSVYINRGEVDKAVEEFQRVIQTDPNHEEVYNNLGIAYKLLGKHEIAEEFFLRAIQLNPDNAGAHSNLAGFYIMKKDYVQALAFAKEALRCDDRWVEAYINLGIAYFYQGQYQEAIIHLKKAIDLDDQQIEAYSNLGLCYFFLEKHENAKSYYQKCLQMEPENVKALINLGTIYFKENNVQGAIVEWKKSIQVDPNSIEAYVNLGSAYQVQEQYDQALNIWKQVLMVKPDHAAAHLNLGNSYYQIGLVNLAIRSWLKTISLNARSVAAHSNLASAYYRQGRLSLAIQEWQNVSSLDPEHAEAYYHLGVIHFNRGNYEKAIHNLSHALHLKPDHSDARIFLDRARWLSKESIKKNRVGL